MSKESSSLDVRLSKELGIDNQDTFSLVFNEDEGVYTLSGIEKIEANVDKVMNLIKETEFVESDKAAIKKLRGSTNKYIAAVKQYVNDQNRQLFGKVKEQQNSLLTKLTTVNDTLKAEIDRFIIEEKEAKKAEFINELNLQIEYHDELSDLMIDDVIEASWLNASSNLSKSKLELQKRLAAIKNIYNSGLVKSKDVREICDYLYSANWLELDAINLINEEYSRRERENEEAKLRKQEAEMAVNKITSDVNAKESATKKEISTLTIKHYVEDKDKIINVLRAAGIKFKII